MVIGWRPLFLTFLGQQSFGYCPRAKRSRSNTRAGVVGYLFETAYKAIAPMWQPGAYIRSCELSSVVERTHSNVARKTKGWLEHEIHHAAENSRGIIEVPAARVDAADNARDGGRITKRLWEIGDIVDVLEAWEAAQSQPTEIQTEA